MRFRKRTSHVDATRWFADGDHERVERRDGKWAVATPEGWRPVQPGDWIVRDEGGNCRPMEDGLFVRCYEPAAD
ncbi:hypothetical protein [Burkholderia cenocepacia]|uniref:hypothetical protein n=1 Tax=Burkholderia cenocepacia TaxID=95486 RepID=UPI002AB6EC1C|nr:hypothetical protein [Burkholderia cenocepacia]